MFVDAHIRDGIELFGNSTKPHNAARHFLIPLDLLKMIIIALLLSTEWIAFCS